MQGRPTFWGKLQEDETGAVVGWHPLVDHCADVAACAEGLLLLSVMGKRLARLAGQDRLTDGQVHRLCVLAALHDFGKVNHGFQRKAVKGAADVAGHVQEAVAALVSQGPEADQLNEALDTLTLQRWAEDPEVPLRLLLASVSHHGRPLNEDDGQHYAARWRAHEGRDPISEVRRIKNAATSWFPLSATTRSQDLLPTEPAFQHAFAGLVMLADWLGSDRGVFRFREDHDSSDRMEWSRLQVKEFFSRTGLDAGSARATRAQAPSGFEDLFEGKTARGAQVEAATLGVDRQGSITLLEAETGSGKTEAALQRFHALFVAGEVDGLYFALPTRTAATQIHKRVFEFISRIFPNELTRPPVVLAVPGYLAVDDQTGTRLAEFKVLWNDSDHERWKYRGWAAEGPKRYLAGAIVVGTVDQLLMSALRVSHAHLRSSAALRHLVIVDEVHASDTYMSGLLGVVLDRHRAAGGHALLMSATLGSSARVRFLDGKRAIPPPLAEATAQPYPSIVHRGDGDELILSSASPGLRKRVRVALQPWMEAPPAVAQEALRLARLGARVLVLRNTVKQCVATQQELESISTGDDRRLLFELGGLPVPHHSRFCKDDRTKLDDALERRYGKAAANEGAIVVATQTVQQSLDLDADVLITDLCPLDVLLQRVGRVHRHERTRKLGFEQAQLTVLTPEVRDLGRLLTTKGEARGPSGIGSVYQDLRVLEASWRALEIRPELVIPEMNRPLVEATTHPEALGALTKELGGAWEAHEQSLLGRGFVHAQQANLQSFSWSNSFGEEVWHDDGRPSTRLGLNDRLVRFEPAVQTPFGSRMCELSLPGWMAGNAPDDALPTVTFADTQRVDFSFGDRRFRYDRLGVRRVEATEEQQEGTE